MPCPGDPIVDVLTRACAQFRIVCWSSVSSHATAISASVSVESAPTECASAAALIASVALVLDVCLDQIAAALREQHPDLGRDVAIDASDLPAFANGQRYLYNHGPERQSYSDPDASWGHRSAVSTRKGGGFYGYKLHMAVCTATDLPIAWRVETGRRNESLYTAPLLDAERDRGFTPQTCAMDKGYDNNRVLDECRKRGVAPVVSLPRDARSRLPRSRSVPRSGRHCTVAARPSSVSLAG